VLTVVFIVTGGNDMDKLLDDYLCKKYPKIFVERNLPTTESCMGRGFECGAGWFFLIDQLCAEIQSRIDRRSKLIAKGYAIKGEKKKIPQFIALQVKEKFGALRIYYRGGDKYIQALVDMIENMSYSVCENCGLMNETVGRVETGWIQSLCPKCSKNYGKTIAQPKDIIALWENVIASRHNPSRSWKAVDELTREDLGLKPRKKKEKK
jgi:hypothetical protein